MLVITRYAVPESEFAQFLREGRIALQALAGRPGCTGGWLGRAVDEPGRWVLATSWESVGAYRRALSSIEVKLAAVPLMYRAADEPSAFEDLVTWTPDGGLADHATAIPDGLSPSSDTGADR